MNNYDNNVTPVTGFYVVVKNSDNASTSWDEDAPIVDCYREKDGDSTTGAVVRVFHAKGKKLASKSGFYLAAREGGRGGRRELRRACWKSENRWEILKGDDDIID